MSYLVLDPTSEAVALQRMVAPRLSTLAGKTVGFISNGKEGTKGFFAHLERLLQEELHVNNVVVRQKSNYSAPAEASIINEAGSWDVTIAGIGD